MTNLLLTSNGHFLVFSDFNTHSNKLAADVNNEDKTTKANVVSDQLDVEVEDKFDYQWSVDADDEAPLTMVLHLMILFFLYVQLSKQASVVLYLSLFSVC